MPSPFPGMDPYLQEQVWPDFHHCFIAETAAALVPQLRPRYVARIAQHVYLQYPPDERPHTISPNMSIKEDHTRKSSGRASGVALLPEAVTIPLPQSEFEKVRRLYLEIRQRGTRELVTAIEVLSPDNKRRGGDRSKYPEKRDLTLWSGANLVEIDLLRGGERLPMGEPLPPADYYVITSRAEERPMAQVLPIALRERLPQIPIPLADGDPDVSLDLQAVFDSVYDRAGYDYSYDYSVDYENGAEPPLSEEEAAWVGELLAKTQP